MKTRILIVEDEPDIVEVVSYNLRQTGYQVTVAADGEAGLRLAEAERPDLIILDLMLPGTDGLDVCRLLKQNEQTRTIPVIMLTARAEEVDRIVGLELGADDYITKPFAPRELVLRVRAVLRRPERYPSPNGESERIHAGPLTIDPAAHEVLLEGDPIELTATEFKLLLTLVQRRGRVQSREELLNVVCW